MVRSEILDDRARIRMSRRGLRPVHHPQRHILRMITKKQWLLALLYLIIFLVIRHYLKGL